MLGAQAVRAAATPSPLLTVTATAGPVESAYVLGANMATWYDVTQSGIAQAFKTAGMRATRWPGGSESDNYHWQTNNLGAGKCAGGYVYPASTLANFITYVTRPANLQLAVTVNYGSNPSCTGGADPAEAATYVRYANYDHVYDVAWWTVGNEEYGSWETDLHSQPHDATQYAQDVASSFYPQMKAQSKTSTNVCVDVEPGWSPAWDPVVLSKAAYDCVELHYYPQAPGHESDAYLIDQAPAGLTSMVEEVKTDLRAAGHPNAPIYVGEIGSVYATPGKQSTSITQALYAGQVIGEMLDDGVARATWWLGFGGCETDGNFSSSLYGWQNYGGYMIFSDGPGACSSVALPARGTLLPTARAFQVAAQFVRGGEHMLAVTLRSLPTVRAYAGTYAGGYAVMLFNISPTAAVTVPIEIAGKTSGTGGPSYVYDKAIYDLSKGNVWDGPTSGTVSAWKGSFNVTLPPWSMTVVRTR